MKEARPTQTKQQNYVRLKKYMSLITSHVLPHSVFLPYKLMKFPPLWTKGLCPLQMYMLKPYPLKAMHQEVGPLGSE